MPANHMNSNLRIRINQYREYLRNGTAGDLAHFYLMELQQAESRLAELEVQEGAASDMGAEHDETPLQQRSRYLRLAAGAMAKASLAADPGARQSWDRLSKAWTDMANGVPSDGTE